MPSHAFAVPGGVLAEGYPSGQAVAGDYAYSRPGYPSGTNARHRDADAHRGHGCCAVGAAALASLSAACGRISLTVRDVRGFEVREKPTLLVGQSCEARLDLGFARILIELRPGGLRPAPSLAGEIVQSKHQECAICTKFE